MKIDFEDDIEHNVVIKLRATGLTGVTFVDLERRKAGDISLSRRIDFPTEYQTRSSVPSDIGGILFRYLDIIEKGSLRCLT